MKIKQIKRALQYLKLFQNIGEKAKLAAIWALEKQVPKQVEEFHGYDLCPVCRKSFGTCKVRKSLRHWEMDYCKYCGQRLEW